MTGGVVLCVLAALPWIAGALWVATRPAPTSGPAQFSEMGVLVPWVACVVALFPLGYIVMALHVGVAGDRGAREFLAGATVVLVVLLIMVVAVLMRSWIVGAVLYAMVPIGGVALLFGREASTWMAEERS